MVRNIQNIQPNDHLPDCIGHFYGPKCSLWSQGQCQIGSNTSYGNTLFRVFFFPFVMKTLIHFEPKKSNYQYDGRVSMRPPLLHDDSHRRPKWTSRLVIPMIWKCLTAACKIPSFTTHMVTFFHKGVGHSINLMNRKSGL